MEYAGKNGVLLSVGVEMQAYGDQAAAASHQETLQSPTLSDIVGKVR